MPIPDRPLTAHRTLLSSRSALWLATALVLAAFLLRVIDLDRRPLHFDEGINVTIGQMSPADILAISRATFDNDPPGHRMALGMWMELAGMSSVSIRIFSVGFSVLMLAALYRLLRNLRLGPVPALVVAVLVAISPYAIDYAQQAKGYAMGAGLAALSWLMWVALVAPARPRPASRRSYTVLCFVAYIVTTALALSTHYYVLLLLPMQWLWFAGMHLGSLRNVFRWRWWKDSFAPMLRGAIGQALAIVPIGIWLALMAASLQVSTARSSTKFVPAPPWDVLGRILAEMSAGQFVDRVPQLVCGVVVLLLAIIGAIRLWRTPVDGRRPVFWFGVSVLVPLAGALVLQQRVTFFFPRFLQYALPSLITLVAGCALPFATEYPLRAALRVASIAAVAGVMVLGMATFYTAPIDSANDFRPLIAQMRPYIKQGDAALGTYIWMEGMFDSYAPESNGTLTWYAETYNTETISSFMTPISVQHPRVWSLNYLRNPDAPDTLSVVWLKRNAAFAERFSSDATTALLFDMRGSNPLATSDALSATAVFSGQVMVQYTPLAIQSRNGDSVPIALAWTALQPIKDHYVIYLHLLSSNGELMAQNDGDAVNGLAPSFTWTPGHPVIEERAVAIPPVAPGQYTLEAGLFREGDGERLHTAGGADNVQVGTITVTK